MENINAPVISISNLEKNFSGKPVLKGINLSVEAGQVVGYIGPNGAGKSTTIKILIGMLQGFKGTVEVLGYDVSQDALEVKKRIGYVPENAQLYEVLTPIEYLLFIGRLYKMDDDVIEKKAFELLKIFDLQGREHTRMHTFSKGMKQKVLLISGLINNPDILFLDEPLSGLDANAVMLVKEILMQLKAAGKTIFYSSHIMDVVEKISDRIVIINHGEVIANGTFEELKARSHTGSLEKIFGSLTGANQETSGMAANFVNALK